MPGGQQGQGWTVGILDAGLGRQNACLQAGGWVGRSCGGLWALNLSLLRSADERAARWHGQADKASCLLSEGTVGPG